MKGIIEFVFELALITAIGSVGFNHIYHQTKLESLKKVSGGTISLTHLNSKLTGQANWLDTPTQKNVLSGMMH